VSVLRNDLAQAEAAAALEAAQGKAAADLEAATEAAAAELVRVQVWGSW
jgi:hypothetical protein